MDTKVGSAALRSPNIRQEYFAQTLRQQNGVDCNIKYSCIVDPIVVRRRGALDLKLGRMCKWGFLDGAKNKPMNGYRKGFRSPLGCENMQMLLCVRALYISSGFHNHSWHIANLITYFSLLSSLEIVLFYDMLYGVYLIENTVVIIIIRLPLLIDVVWLKTGATTLSTFKSVLRLLSSIFVS